MSPDLTLHEHNHFTAQIDFVGGTVTVNGAINIMQRPRVGSVILNAGHKVFDSETGLPLVLKAPTAPTMKTSATHSRGSSRHSQHCALAHRCWSCSGASLRHG